jgi:hypothetical protein
MADNGEEGRKAELARGIADYVETHNLYESLTKREAIIAAVRVLTDDIGAAQEFVTAIGLDVDLYTTDLTHIGRNVTGTDHD